MERKHVSLTNAEWNIMECLWEASPRSGKEAWEHLSQSVGWKRSTTLTMLRRMTQKGLLLCETKDGVNVYFPLVKREDAVIKETEDFLNRVYNGSVSMMVSAMAKRQKLTEEELEELYAVLREIEKEGEKK